MFRNYLKVAWRILRKNKAYSLINLGGLALGMACCLLILMYVRDELSYDRFHQHAGRIYRVIAESGNDADRLFDSANTSFPIGPKLKEVFPEVLDAIRFREGYKAVVSYAGQSYAEKKFYFTDPTVFEVFTFAFANGAPQTALKNPHSVVLTARAARKYFGDDDPVGKTLHYEGWGGPLDLTVSGVLADLPHNSHFDFEFLTSLQLFENEEFYWTWFTSLWTYVLLPEDYPPDQLRQKFPEFVAHYVKPNLEGDDSWFMLDLEPLTAIHLHSQLDKQMKATSNILYVYLFSGIAIIILTLACINFTNLAIARSLKRVREVGMRKTLGGQRRDLLAQFLGETLLLAILALVLAITLTELVLPIFREVADKAITIDYFGDGFVMAALLGMTFVTTMLAGSYPALLLSRLRPVIALKQLPASGRLGRLGIRQGLVTFQFVVSSVLIIATLVIYQQLDYLRGKHLGANIEQVVVTPMSEDAEAFIHELRQHPSVINASASSRVPVNLESFDTRPVYVEGFEQAIQMENFNVDESFLATYEIELAAGRDLSREFGSDTASFLLNESAVQEFGWDSPPNALGKQIGWQFGFKKGQVVGVVKDFHLVSFHEKIRPLILHKMSRPFWYNFISIRVQTRDLAETLRMIESTWRQFNPKGGYEYFFVDESFANLLRADEHFGRIVLIFTAMAITIACLGLFGLISYSAEQRTKEIGVRKVLGASVKGIVALLSGDFVKLVLLASIVAWPLAWYAMNAWLENFAYRIDLNWWNFALAGGIVLGIALATVSTQAIRAALANPVESLRYE